MIPIAITINDDGYMIAQLHHWERPKRTFHAKGIWLREEKEDNDDDTSTVTTTTTLNDTSEVAAVVVGFSNFRWRSFC